MGMFDYVIVEVPIEGIPDPARMEWQTKDFDEPFLEKYRITADGRLLHEEVHYEDRSDPNAPEGSLERLRGMMTKVHEEWRDVNYHGDLSFCGTLGGTWREDDFYSVTARFTDGQLVSITRDRDEATGYLAPVLIPAMPAADLPAAAPTGVAGDD